MAGLQSADEFEPKEFLAHGDKVAVLGHYTWHVKATGRKFSSDFVHVFTVQNGKITNMHEYLDTHAAVQAYAGSHAAAH